MLSPSSLRSIKKGQAAVDQQARDRPAIEYFVPPLVDFLHRVPIPLQPQIWRKAFSVFVIVSSRSYASFGVKIDNPKSWPI